MPYLPASTQEYLATGSAPGNRNNALMSAACQFRDAGFFIEETIQELFPRADADGLGETEILSTIRSVFSRAPREQCGGGFTHKAYMHNGDQKPKPTYRKVDVKSQPLPNPLDNGAIEFLKTKFLQEEFVAIGEGYVHTDDKGKKSIAINRGTVRMRDTWIADIKQHGFDVVFPGLEGIFVRINPMKDASGGADKDVASYRDILIESDTGSLDDQFGAIQSIGLPATTVAWSANRSVQGQFRVNAPDEKTYREWFEILRQYCNEALGLEIDESNKNPSRYSRLPGGKRTRRVHDTCELIPDEKGNPIIDRQTLLAVNLPGKPWEQWLERLPIDDGAEVITVSQLLTFDRDNDPDCIFGNRWACAGHSVVVQGPSGIGKSSFAMQWIICSSLGRTLLDIPCFKPRDNRPMKSMLIQAENDEGDLAEAFQDITAKMGLNDDEFAQVERNVVFLRQDQKSGLDFIEFVRRRVQMHKPNIVFGDPLLAYIGGDILQQNVLSQFLRAWLNPILREFALLWIWVQHTGKPGKQSGLEKTHEEKKYAGLSSSELTNWGREIITMTELPAAVFELSFGKRWRRTGILGPDGYPAKTINIQQSNCGTVWENMEGPRVEGGFKALKSRSNKDKVLKYIIDQKSVTQAQIKTWAPENDIAINTAVNIAKSLVADEFEPRIYCYKRQTEGKANTNKADVYTTIAPKT